MPLHPVAIELLRRTGPLAVSSANVSGRPPATTVDDAIDHFGDDVEVYLDGGPSPAATPSTIVDCTGEVPKVLRVGAVEVAAVRDVAPTLELPVV
jgi:tRNA A37 threonylcarbamoyladenosine synthetase subunit TsaC/SUA5/YrdC